MIGRAVEQRAEILGLIARLRAGRPAGGSDRRATKPKPEPQAAVARHSRPAPPTDPTLRPSSGELGKAVRALEVRLSRIEDHLWKHSKPAAAPEGATAPSDTTFSGVLKGQMLSDMLQLVSSNQMSGIFVIESEVGKCSLYFEEGRIRHAEGEGLTGEDAFFAAFGAETGKYHFRETVELPPETTVSSGTQYLVLEALRRMDERNGP